MYSDEGYETQTSKDAFLLNSTIRNKEGALLQSDLHIGYLLKSLSKIHSVHYSPVLSWLSLWGSNGLYVLLGREGFYNGISDGRLSILNKIADRILTLQTTGISGGKYELPNLGATYAAVALFKTLRRENELDKEKIVEFIREMKQKNGFTMYKDGEIDLRSTYCAVATFSLLHTEEIHLNNQTNPLDTPIGKELFKDTTEYIYSTQSYEGGYGAAPGEEAHGGYTYCALATLKILQKSPQRPQALKRWLEQRQDRVTKGFNGRTNKGVDSCYNFWVGACFGLIEEENRPKYSTTDLVTYTLSNCQQETGGLKNIPDSKPDVYHTSYALLGLYIQEAKDFNYALGVPIS
ncbi:protein farnesyltransferase subunit beta [Nematocida sp. AWRm80]|nr:protein farnesyltransferase subunit beta [Nematocida sp. AWRm80]